MPIKPFLNCSAGSGAVDGSRYPGVPQPELGAVGRLRWGGVGHRGQLGGAGAREGTWEGARVAAGTQGEVQGDGVAVGTQRGGTWVAARA